MTRFWGDESWKQAAYAKAHKDGLFGAPETVKQANEEIVSAFRKRLKEVAGFASRRRAVANEKQYKCRGLLFVSRITKICSGENH